MTKRKRKTRSATGTPRSFPLHLFVEAILTAARASEYIGRMHYVVASGDADREVARWLIVTDEPKWTRSHWRTDPSGMIWSHEPNSERRVVYERCFGMERMAAVGPSVRPPV